MKKLSLLVVLCTFSMLAFAQIEVTLAPSGTSDLGNQPMGFRALTPLVLANNGSGTIHITGIAVSPNGPYSIFDDPYTSCPSHGQLAGRAHCEIVVGFTASDVGEVQGTLMVTYAESDQPLRATLTATGVYDVTIIAPTPHLEELPCNYHITDFFGPSPCTVTLLNQEPTTLGSISFGVEPEGDFSIDTTLTTCGSSLSFLSSCTISVQYNGDMNLEEGVLQVTSDSPDGRTIKFRVQGCRIYTC